MLAGVWAVHEDLQCFVDGQPDQRFGRRCWRIDRPTRAGAGLQAGYLHTVHRKETASVPAHTIDGMRPE